VRIAPNEYSIDDPSAVKIIYGLGTKFYKVCPSVHFHALNNCTYISRTIMLTIDGKSSWYVASGSADPANKDLFTERDPAEHTKLRRKVATLYSATTLLRMEPFVDECVEIFSQRLQEVSETGAPINMQHWMQCYAFDVIGYITVRIRCNDRHDCIIITNHLCSSRKGSGFSINVRMKQEYSAVSIHTSAMFHVWECIPRYTPLLPSCWKIWVAVG
jgi:hypothetical protein